MDLSSAVITGTIALLAVTAWRVLPGLSRIVQSLSKLRRSFPYVRQQLDYINEIEKNTNKLRNVPANININTFFSKNIRLNNVSFTYTKDRNFSLKNIDIEILKGSSVGVIGSSGSGKSTFVDILIGLLEPQKGSLTVDGKLVNSSNISKWLCCIGYVPQKPYIHDGTIAQNVAFSWAGTEDEKLRVLEACRLASMDFMHEFSGGINTNIGERGMRLSGGQGQRIAIARALYKNPDIIVFDEATSALDSATEGSILKTIYKLIDLKTTTIIVAHRLSTVKKCDSVVWIEDGEIIMQGSPEVVIEEYSRNQ